MSFKSLNKFRRSLSLRLTIWYAGIFTLTALIILSVFYYRISSVTMEHTNDELLEDYSEHAEAMKNEGLEGVTALFDQKILEEAENNIFFRLISTDGHVIRSSDTTRFGLVEVHTGFLDIPKNGERYVVETLDLPHHEYKVQTLYGVISPDIVFNMGISLEDNYEYLSLFRNLIFLMMIPLVIGAAIIGWFLARHALGGVEAVTKTAMEITKGTMAKRVSVKQHSLEIDRLADTFNDMLDRIQLLIKGMREMNDNVAHDLRSPLTRIRGIAEMTLMGKSSTDDYREMAISTIEECDKLIDIINTVLDITETEAGVRPFAMESFDVIELIRSVCELFDPIAMEKEIRLITVIPDSLMIRGDRRKMQRLVSNLIENAVKYNRRGGTVTISVVQEAQRVSVEVADTGLGIPEEDLPRIFERFYRCDQSRSQSGIGLGLSLAKAIAKGLGGDIKVTSAMDRGSSFVVELPA